MSSLMEDDYAPATRRPWLATFGPLLLIAALALLVWWLRHGE
jgi:hypothetical protein